MQPTPPVRRRRWLALPLLAGMPVLARAAEIEATLKRLTRLSERLLQLARAEGGRLRRDVASDLRGLLRYEPGVSIENGATRFGLGNIAIRGLDGNRVQMTVDGIRLPETYRVGLYANASRNALGLGLLKQVEIVRDEVMLDGIDDPGSVHE